MSWEECDQGNKERVNRRDYGIRENDGLEKPPEDGQEQEHWVRLGPAQATEDWITNQIGTRPEHDPPGLES